MANGYVPRFGRPNPFMQQQALLQQQQQQAAQQQAQQAQLLRSSDPSTLFAPQHAQEQAQCLFPNAFPAQGPNVFQRFWIWLFSPLVRIIVFTYKTLHATYTGLRSAETYAALRKGDVQLLLACFGLDVTLPSTEELINVIVLNRWSLLIGLVVIVALSQGAWFLSPKGENQSVWRSTLILSFASCYIMWAITFMAQWHPLIEPRMTGLRPGYRAGS